MPIISISGKEIPYNLRRSKRAKYLRMEHSITGINLIAPISISNRLIIQFMFDQKKWILKRSRNHREHGNKFEWPEVFCQGESFPFMGERITIDINYTNKKASPILIGHVLKISVPFNQSIKGLSDSIQLQVVNWLKLQAKNHVKRLVGEYSNKLGRRPSGVTIKQQKRRWGSCGIHDHIYINWLLILTPMSVLSYVVLHECCHLFYRNHGSRFWGLVKKYMPNYKAQEVWLKNHSGLIVPPSK